MATEPTTTKTAFYDLVADRHISVTILREQRQLYAADSVEVIDAEKRVNEADRLLQAHDSYVVSGHLAL